MDGEYVPLIVNPGPFASPCVGVVAKRNSGISSTLSSILGHEGTPYRRAGGAAISMRAADELIAKMQSTMTLGELMQDVAPKGIIRAEHLEALQNLQAQARLAGAPALRRARALHERCPRATSE